MWFQLTRIGGSGFEKDSVAGNKRLRVDRLERLPGLVGRGTGVAVIPGYAVNVITALMPGLGEDGVILEINISVLVRIGNHVRPIV